MGSNISKEIKGLSEPIQSLLKGRGLNISNKTTHRFLADVEKAAPWFAVSGSITIPSWEKLGKDLEQADGLGPGTRPLWRMIHSCLKEGSHTEIIKAGRVALRRHQDSTSEGSQSETKARDRSEERGEQTSAHNPVVPSAPLYLELKEFASLYLSDEDSSPEEENLYSRKTKIKKPVQKTGRQKSDPEGPRGRARLIPAAAWEGVSWGCPVFEDGNQQRQYVQMSNKELRELAESVQKYGVQASYTMLLLQRHARGALSPTDWQDIAKACLSMGQYLDWKSIVTELAHEQARQNAENGQPAWNADMLLGKGQWVNNQQNYPVDVYLQINTMAIKAWKALSNRGEVSGNLTKIIQGSTEPFADFVARMMEAAGRIFGDSETAMPLVKQLLYEQCTKDCRRAITPFKGKDIEVWMKACREIGGPLSNAGLAAAILSVHKRQPDGSRACFNCGKLGHLKRDCRAAPKASTGQKIPGTCPRCKKGKHWANECRSTKDLRGQPLISSANASKNGARPPPRGPKVFGAHVTEGSSREERHPLLTPTHNPSEPRKAPQGWTSVPPPSWY